MTYSDLQALAGKHNCRVHWAQIRNGNSPFHGQTALFVNCRSNGRATHFVGDTTINQHQAAAEWIKRNSGLK